MKRRLFEKSEWDEPTKPGISNPLFGDGSDSESNSSVNGTNSESDWNVTVPGAGVYKVPAISREQAIERVTDWLNSGGDPDLHDRIGNGGKKSPSGGFYGVSPGSKIDPRFVTAKSVTESMSIKEILEYQEQGGIVPEHVRRAIESKVQNMVSELVKKKPGGGGYILYSPNKGKKKSPKAVGEFPTKLAAKQAELARFPPDDPEALKRARARLAKILKDPKKRIEMEKNDITSRKKPKKSGAPKRERRKESVVHELSAMLKESLFPEDDIPGSPWDERISTLSPEAISSDKTYHGYHKGIQRASAMALVNASKALQKIFRGNATVKPGEVGIDDRRRSFMPLSIDYDGDEIGPIHVCVDGGGSLKIELPDEVRQAIQGLDPERSSLLRDQLQEFQDDYLSEICDASDAWTERDSYLDKLKSRAEKHIKGLSPIELHIIRQALDDGSSS